MRASQWDERTPGATITTLSAPDAKNHASHAARTTLV
jgi:hypothetical protein